VCQALSGSMSIQVFRLSAYSSITESVWVVTSLTARSDRPTVEGDRLPPRWRAA